MPLVAAVASPELASGKVFIHYPIAQPQQESMAIITNEEMLEQQSVNDSPVTESNQVTASQNSLLPIVTAAAVEVAQPEPVVAQAVEPEVKATVIEQPVEVAPVEVDAVEATQPEP